MRRITSSLLICAGLSWLACQTPAVSVADAAQADGGARLDAGADGGARGEDAARADSGDRSRDAGRVADTGQGERGGDGAQGAGDAAQPDATQHDAGHSSGPDAGAAGSFVAVTFNTGIHPNVGQAGWTRQMSQYLDTYYGHGLCWAPAIAEARAFLNAVRPDVVSLQEIFDIAECEHIPAEARVGFVCEGWTPEAPSVEERILGSGYQVVCNQGSSDKCAAVKTSFARFRGCSDGFCYDGLDGQRVSGCGSGSRVGRGHLDLVAGGSITLVNVHGSSGVSADDKDCRVAQVDQVFVDLGDGAPAANGPPNLIMGDFNTDPRSRATALIDPSARRWSDFVGPGLSFAFINEHVLTYSNVACIDNVVSDQLSGSCWSPGYSSGHPELSPEGYFDHVPTVCDVELP